jgi:hypothetical protein
MVLPNFRSYILGIIRGICGLISPPGLEIRGENISMTDYNEVGVRGDDPGAFFLTLNSNRSAGHQRHSLQRHSQPVRRRSPQRQNLYEERNSRPRRNDLAKAEIT